MISNETREFVDDIDDQVIKAELVHVISTVDAIEAGAGKDERSEEFVKAFNRSVEGYQGAIRNQHASINRLLDERRQSFTRISQLEEGLAAERSWRERKVKVGPE
jgi:hypothetical protein